LIISLFKKIIIISLTSSNVEGFELSTVAT